MKILIKLIQTKHKTITNFQIHEVIELSYH